MSQAGKATRIDLFNFSTPQMRAFHLSWFAFFLCFFAWFGLSPLMAVVRDEMHLSKEQVGWIAIGSVAITILSRVGFGWLSERIGPRLAYTWLLTLGSLPVMGIGLARGFETFLIFRVLIGAIGASFVITQYHTSLMFAPNCIGMANATTAGWGNAGGGVTHIVMPKVFALLAVTMGLGAFMGWRVAMLCAGVLCFLTGIAYYFLTQDTPQGNFADLRVAGLLPPRKAVEGSFGIAVRDPRVWALAVLYGACFGVELTWDVQAALYFKDYFQLSLEAAGLAAGSFGFMHLFARTLGGFVSDKLGGASGLKGRVSWLFATILVQGLGLMLFSRFSTLWVAVPTMLFFGLFMKMAEGATFAIVPFVNRKAMGSVAGIVGAGGNVAAVAAGFLFKGAHTPTAFLTLGAIVAVCSFVAFAVRFSAETEAEASREFRAAVARRDEMPELVGAPA